MGDRAHCIIVNEYKSGEQDPPLYIYSHNHGRILPRIVATAMRRAKDRAARDHSYTARVIVDELTAHQLSGPHNSAPDDRNGDHQIGVGIHTKPIDETANRWVKLHYGPYNVDMNRTHVSITIGGRYDRPVDEITLHAFIERFAFDTSEYADLMHRLGGD